MLKIPNSKYQSNSFSPSHADSKKIPSSSAIFLTLSHTGNLVAGPSASSRSQARLHCLHLACRLRSRSTVSSSTLSSSPLSHPHCFSHSSATRPPPPLPELHITEEATNLAADFFRTKINSILSASRDIALGRDSNLFCKVAACLWLISVVSSWTDFLTLAYSCLAVVLTIPVLYEKYEDIIDKYLLLVYIKLKIIYEKLDEDCSGKVKKWILENGKLS